MSASAAGELAARKRPRLCRRDALENKKLVLKECPTLAFKKIGIGENFVAEQET